MHETTRQKGVTVEKHLCEKCASEQGLAANEHNPVHELLQQFAVAHAALLSQGATRQTCCPACSLTFAEFKQGGMVGCAMCYRAFEAQLGPLLERAHEGAARHVGKQPARLSALAKEGHAPATAPSPGAVAEERAKTLNDLRKQLDEAIKSEQYERAAKLRDQLRSMSQGGPPAESKVNPNIKPTPGTPG